MKKSDSASGQLELITIPSSTVPLSSEYPLIAKLLQQVTTRTVIADYLKAKDVAYSGTWPELLAKRLPAALNEGKISIDDLKTIIAETEEYGSQHVFLYKCSAKTAAELMDEANVKQVADSLGIADRIGLGKVLDEPTDATISAIRWDQHAKGSSLVIKIVERREERKYLGESPAGQNRVKKEWEIVPIRAVSIVRLYSFGLLEIRTTSHWVSLKYADDLFKIKSLVRPFLGDADFQEFSLSDAKKNLLADHKDLKDLVRISSSRMRTDTGGKIDAGVDEEGDLYADAAVAAGVEAIQKRGAFCDAASVYWIAKSDGLPSRDIHMLLSGQRNEFAITGDCSKQDYEFVFDQLRARA